MWIGSKISNGVGKWLAMNTNTVLVQMEGLNKLFSNVKPEDKTP